METKQTSSNSEAKQITRFKGKYVFLSNFYPSEVSYLGDSYPTVEHAYQAAKNPDRLVRHRIAKAPTPSIAKKMGKNVELAPRWDSVKLAIMEELLRQKFSIPYLAELLLETGDSELIEGNWWGDCFWGVCNGKGENNLGKLLMKIREEIRNSESFS